MAQVSTPEEIERESKRVITALYGDVTDFRINETFAIRLRNIKLYANCSAI